MSADIDFRSEWPFADNPLVAMNVGFRDETDTHQFLGVHALALLWQINEALGFALKALIRWNRSEDHGAERGLA
jgi:hypothetical protein